MREHLPLLHAPARKGAASRSMRHCAQGGDAPGLDDRVGAALWCTDADGRVTMEAAAG